MPSIFGRLFFNFDEMKDIFSGHADIYAKHRPGYPSELIEYVVKYVNERDLAWDCGTGNGQTAAALSDFFKMVHATDISQSQLALAPKLENIHYAAEPSGRSSLLENSVDLVTVSQAIHWFDLDKFYREVRRVSKPKAIIAVWGYSLLNINEIINPFIEDFYFNVLNGYWDPERKYLDEGYKTIPFPFSEITVPSFSMKLNWNREALEGYLDSWSAVQKYKTINKINPVTELSEKLNQLWKSGSVKEVSFPIHLKMGYIN
jgi:ubiquinone/menaquinone biosynthesis C-methylase UbiE